MNMEVRPVQSIDKQDVIYSAFYKSLEEILSAASTKVTESKTLFNIGVSDELFKFIEMAHKDPLSLISHKIDTEAGGIHALLDGMVRAFLEANRDSIERFFRANHQNNALYYYLVLKADSNKRPFLKFLFDYENKPISRKFPIIFDFISLETFNMLEKEYQTVPDGGISRTGQA